MTTIIERLDRIASELELLDPRLALAVDHVSDQLENIQAAGVPLELENLTPEDIKKKKVQVVIQASSILNDRAIMAFVVEAGLKTDFLNLFHKGKNYWESTWNGVKDKATQALIKGLNTADKVKKFIVEHPELKYVVLAALALGFLALPSIASADILQPEKVKELADSLQWYSSGGGSNLSISVQVPQGWTDEVVLNSLKGHGLADIPNVMKDVYTNLNNILMEKGRITGMIQDNPDTFKELAKTTLEGLQTSINTILNKFI